MLVQKYTIKNLFFIRLNPGDDVLAGIEKAVKDSNIANAVILSGVGSVTSHSYHVVGSPALPPKNEYIKGERPADIVNINGFVINGRIHAHIVFSDLNNSYGGHLESGVRILTFGAVTLADVDADFEHWDHVGRIEDVLP
ncbi:MAG: DNA-binding protein [Treponema sp.]|jgi:predicted DNA-binding protein with PD1-like motif|nr:DNA-binding protein [Treponema sp.]